MKKNISRRLSFWLTVCAVLCALALFACTAAAENECPHDDWVEVFYPIEPTCTQPGLSRLLRCVRCGLQKGGNTIAPLGHDPDGEWEIQRPATCASEGKLGRRCMRCGAWAETKTVPRLSYHSDPEGEPISLNDFLLEPETFPTCTQAGAKATYQCPTCGLIKGGEEIAPLGHDVIGAEWELQKEATCVQDGVKVRRCMNCGMVMQRQTLRATGVHAPEYNLNDPSCICVPAQEPACDQPGYGPIYQCPLCGETKGGERREPRHAWGEWQQVTEGSCTAEGLQRRVCGKCGKTEEKSSGYGHQIAAPEVVTPATCTTQGVSRGLCSLCGEYQNIPIPPTGHDFSEAVVLQPPTCVSDGKAGLRCAKCGQVKEDGILPATGEHTFETVIEAKDPTCTEPGAVGLRRCAVCGAEEGTEDVIPALGHRADGWRDELAPTCGASGLSKKICAVCGRVLETRELPPTGMHSWQLLEEGVPATCTEAGVSDKLICEICGAQKGGEALEPLGHDMDGLFSDHVRPATCAQEGLILLRCPRCGEEARRKVQPRLSYHTDNEGNRCDPVLIAPETPPTCTEPGVKACYQCPTCGAVIGGEAIPAAHVWGSWEVISEGSCTQPMERRRQCDICGQQQTDASVLGHQWTETTIQPECEVAGSVTAICAVCGAQQTKVLPALGHEFMDEPYYMMPSCTTQGSISQRCMRCGKRTVLATLPATGEHAWTVIMQEDPTCTETGVRLRQCMNCGLQKDPEILPAYGHDLNGSPWEVRRMATCAAEGQMARRCNVCGAWAETKPIAKLNNHEWMMILEDEPATCTQNGRKPLQECQFCGAQKGGEVIPALGHALRLFDVIHPSCDVVGREFYTCTRCNSVECVTLPTAHAWGGWENDPDDASLQRRLCRDCGKKETRQKPACEHPSVSSETVLAATCTTEGSVKFQCTVCGTLVETKVLPALGHDYTGGQYVVTKAPTCVENGTGALICDRCGYRDPVRTLSATGIHAWQTEAEAVPATCTEAGLTKILKCSGCGAQKGGETIKALGHDFGGWATVTPPTCASEGVRERRCARCNAAETQPLAATGEHDWQTAEEAQQPTCTVSGKAAVLACSVCGARKGGEVLDARHTWGQWVNLREPASCQEPGLRRRECTVCGQTEEQAIESHEWMVEDETLPTCSEPGQTVMVCSVCGKRQVKTRPATGRHAYIHQEEMPTCAAGGYIRDICEICGDVSFSYEMPATGWHAFILFEEGVPATCTEPGRKAAYQCEICGQFKDKDAVLPARGHQTTGSPWMYESMPGCETAGKAVRQCMNCGEIVEEMILPARGHAWVAITPALAPTCTLEGNTALEQCPDCGAIRGSEPLPALGHNILAEVLTAPTATADGLERRYCTRCDLSKHRVLPATGSVLTLPALLTEVDEEAFAGTAVRSVVIPDTVYAIRAQAFAGCTALAAIHMPDSVTDIAEDAFERCNLVWFLCESDNAAARFARDHGIEYIIE